MKIIEQTSLVSGGKADTDPPGYCAVYWAIPVGAGLGWTVVDDFEHCKLWAYPPDYDGPLIKAGIIGVYY